MTPILRVLLAIGLAAIGDVASAADYSGYRVIDSTPLDLMAGPSDTALLLSPDGTRLLHIGTREMCLLAPADATSWGKAGCIRNTRELKLHGPEDMLWSPQGDRLVMPTYAEGLLAFRDTDIRVLDPKTMTVTNLTDDGIEDSLFDNRMPGNFDLGARWLDNETLVFLRYPIPEGGVGKGGPPSLMTINAAGGAPKILLTIPGADRLAVYALAVSVDGRRIAYGNDTRDKAADSGIYIFEVGGTATRRVAAMKDVGKAPAGMAFSADGGFLLLLSSTETGLDARVLDVATGRIAPVDAARRVIGVAWSPAGAALVYVTIDRAKPDAGGLFLANRPGEPGRQLLKGALMPPVCCGSLPIIWAANDTMIIGDADNHDAPLFVRLGR